MKAETKEALIFVLGMHRSGTSAITRSLKVMGVSLGERLMPPIAGVNDKGFWEDLDLNALNIEILKAIAGDWFHLTPIETTHVEALRTKGYFLHAAVLLREKLKRGGVVAFKDPRMAKLLPFWNEVTDHLQLNVSCVLTLRHPLSVVKSLAKRDGFFPEHSYLLWLGHVLESLRGSKGKSRILVDYDRLMQSPNHELSRIANVFHLPINDAELAEYNHNFLDQGLRHTVYRVDDLLLDSACPSIVYEVYSRLLKVASDQSSLDDPSLAKEIGQWIETFQQLKTSLNLADKQYSQIASLSQAVAERDKVVEELSGKTHELSEWGKGLQATVAERDKVVVELNGKTHEVSEWGKGLQATVAERDQQLADLNQALVAKKAELMKMSDWAYGMMQELERMRTPLHIKLTDGAKVAKQILRRTLANTVLGDLVRHVRDGRRYRANMVSFEAIRRSLQENQGRLIITFPIITWDFRWQRPQHIVSRLRDNGYSIVYLAMSMAPLQRRFRNSKEAGAALQFNNLSRHINQIWLHSRDSVNIYTDPLAGDDLHNVVSGLRSLLTELKPKSIHYLLHFPGWWPVTEALRESHGGRVVFDCMDDHGGFSTNTAQALETEHSLIKQADLVITSSVLLEDRCKVLNPNTLQVKNGTEFYHFREPKPNGELDLLKGQPTIGYYGAISDWFDMELVAYCARQRPQWQFVLIGATVGADLSPVDGLPNVHFLGEKPYAELPGYLAYFDVCTIPFKLIPLTLATNPVKFYEYLSAGKPVVSVDLPELLPYSDNCYLASNAEQFVEQLELALQEKDNPQKVACRFELAQANSWDVRAKSILTNPVFN